MELNINVKNILKNDSGITLIELIIAISILVICMTYFVIDANNSSTVISELDKRIEMINTAQQAIERLKVELTAGNANLNGYNVEVIEETDTGGDEAMTYGLRKFIMRVYNPNIPEIGDVIIVSYVEPLHQPLNLVITTDTSDITNASSIIYTFKFDDDVTGFEESDVEIENGEKVTFTVVNGSTYTLVVTNTNDALITQTVSIPENICTNSTGSGNPAISKVVIIDAVPLTGEITASY